MVGTGFSKKLPRRGSLATAVAVVAAFLCMTIVMPIATAQANDGSKNRFFRGLATGIEFYSKIAAQGGWPQVPSGPTLKVGMSDPRVSVLRKRLSMTGDYLGADIESAQFDAELKAGVIAYQTRNGEEPDGIVGKGTLASLNVPVRERIRQMKINRERWALMPAALGKRFVLVNMAGFELNVIEGEKSVLNMRVVVGKDYHSTPMFSDTIKFIEFNPYWNVPRSIATKELVPDYAKGTGSAERQGFEVVRGEEAAPITSVKWSKWVGKDELPFRIRQRPGPANALGEMKFMFPNKHNVYLHDTNARSLFNKTVRAFSHGCVRLQKPRELATYLLAANEGWARDRIDAVVASGDHTTVNLNEPVPVHLAYMTAWMDWKGLIQFRPDIYGRDAELGKILPSDTPPPPVAGTDDPLAGSIVPQTADPQLKAPEIPQQGLAGTDNVISGSIVSAPLSDVKAGSDEALPQTRATPPEPRPGVSQSGAVGSQSEFSTPKIESVLEGLKPNTD